MQFKVGEEMKGPRVVMPVLDKVIRRSNFEEVACGYSLAEAQLEASRCLDCKNPRCVPACPVSIDIPKFIGSGSVVSSNVYLKNY